MMVFAWVVGFILLFLMTFITNEITSYFGITTFIEYDEPIVTSNRYYEEEVDGHNTGLGFSLMILSFAVAIRGGMAVDTRTLSGGVSVLGNYLLGIFIIGLLFHGIIHQILYFILDLPSFLRIFLEAIFAIGIFYFGYKIYKEKERVINSKS